MALVERFAPDAENGVEIVVSDARHARRELWLDERRPRTFQRILFLAREGSSNLKQGASGKG